MRYHTDSVGFSYPVTFLYAIVGSTFCVVRHAITVFIVLFSVLLLLVVDTNHIYYYCRLLWASRCSCILTFGK